MARVWQLLVLAVAVSAVCAQDWTATVAINKVTSPLWEAAQTLWGIMYEELMHQGAGGLHSELLQNGFFQTTSTISPWTVQAIGGGSASNCNMTLDGSLPHINEILPKAMSLQSKSAYACGAVNTGFSAGIGVRAGVKYNVSLYAHTTSALAEQVTVTVQLWSSSNAVLGEATIDGIDEEWDQYFVQITPNNTADVSGAKFVVIVAGNQQVWLHGISLMPNMFWHGLNFLRTDIAQMLEDMVPAFVRFPGGCFVEGDTMKNAFRWKQAIGPNIERPGNQDLWGYYSPNFLGPYEMMLFTEALGAAPIWVVNSGAAHNDYVNDSEIGEWIQDAVDACEFALGDETSTWGAKRAAMGHPEPFREDNFYIAIGNEEDFNNLNKGGLPLYTKYYPMFYNAIKAKYPNIMIVANNATVIVGGKDAKDQVAEFHDYDPAEHFITIRELWAVWQPSAYMFVSEYGATCSSGSSYCPSPWASAVAEAAFMIGMERYSNMVIMACAETIGQEAVFNALQMYGTPSYYTKMVFAEQLGTNVLDTVPTSTSHEGSNITITAVALTRENTATGGLEIVLKMANWGASPVTVTVSANGFPTGWQLGSTASVWTVLNGTTTTAQNSFDNPKEVYPNRMKDFPLNMVTPGTTFTVVLPYSSIHVAVIPLVKSSEVPVSERTSYRAHKRRHHIRN